MTDCSAMGNASGPPDKENYYFQGQMNYDAVGANSRFFHYFWYQILESADDFFGFCCAISALL